MKSDMPIIAKGVILDRDFEIGDIIGGGGFGHIYEGYQLSLDRRRVAIKFERFSENWQNDASVLARINSKFYLPEVYKKFELMGGDRKKYVCLVMEYIDGRTMEDIVKNLGHNERVPIERIIKWLNQLCQALEELHSKDIIHSDVKPSNIMIDGNDDIKLIDFNTAIINKRIGAGGLCVSNGYSPPEQYATPVTEVPEGGRSGLSVFGKDETRRVVKWIPGTADRTSDIYAAGAVLYYLLFKHRPQTSENRTSQRFVTERSGLIKEYTSFYSIIEKATALTKTERYQSAGEMRTALNKAYKRTVFWTKKTKIITVACVLTGVLAVTGGAAVVINHILNGQTVEASAFALYEEGNALIDAGDFDGAERIFDDSIEDFDTYDAQIFLYALRAGALCGKGEYERFLAEYESYSAEIREYKGKHSGFFAEIMFYTGEAYYYIGDYLNAAAYYEKAILSNNEEIDYKKALMRTLAVLGEIDSLERVKAELGDTETAQIGADWLYFFDGVAKKNAGLFAEAEEDFLKASVTRDEKLLWAVVFECSGMFAENDENGKQIAFLSDKQKMFSSVSMSVVVNERLGGSLRKVGFLEEALACYEYLTELQPNSYRAHELLASILDEMKRYEDEIVVLDKMIALAPQNIRAYTLYINALFKLSESKPYEERDFTEAYEMFKKAEAINADDPDVIIYRDIFDNLGLNDLLQSSD